MDLQPQPVAESVEKTDIASLLDFGGVAFQFKEIPDLILEFFPFHPRGHGFESAFLSIEHGIPEAVLGLAGFAAHDGPGHVAEVSRLRIAREDIQDDQGMGLERAVSALMRIACLDPARHDRAGRGAACP